MNGFFSNAVSYLFGYPNPNVDFETLWSQSDVDQSNLMLKDICQRTIAHYLSAPNITVTRISREGLLSGNSLSIYYRSPDQQMERNIQVHYSTDRFESTHYIPGSISFE